MKTNTMYLKPVTTLVLVLLFAAIAFATGCAVDDHQSSFDVKGPVADRQLSITMITLWVSTFIFVCVGSLLVYAVFRFRARGEIDPTAPLPAQTHGNAILEMVLTVISIGLLVVIAFPTIPTIFRLAEMPKTSDAVVVTVTGWQWWWSFRYENTQKKVMTANELRIPVGKPVLLRLEAGDVIHSFWVPKLAGKVDLIPNQHNDMWLVADKVGWYWGQCAEFCGTSHANMRLRVIAMYPSEFDRWVAAQDMPAGEPPAGSDASLGKQIFENGPRQGHGNACSTCHTVKGSTKSMGTTGPDLTHFASRTTIGAGILDNTDENLKKWLRNPAEVKPGNLMSAQGLVKLDQEEVNALAAYLQTLK